MIATRNDQKWEIRMKFSLQSGRHETINLPVLRDCVLVLVIFEVMTDIRFRVF